jgi:hypothetical protein
MKSGMRLVLLKTLFLLLAAVLPFLPFIIKVKSVYCFAGAFIFGLLYILAGSREVKLSAARSSEAGERFNYIPFKLISKKIIRAAFFLMVAAVLIAPEIRLVQLEPAILTIAAGEILFFLTGIRNRFYYISLNEDYIYIKQDRELKIFSNEITHVDYRYEIFYLVLKNRGTIKLNPEFIAKEERKRFTETTVSWIRSNGLVITDDATAKLKEENLW